MHKIYLLEYRVLYYHDDSDDEDFEYRRTIGYFSDMEKVNCAIEKCRHYGIKSTKLVVKEYPFVASINQKYVYILKYEFSNIIDGYWMEYYYAFDPLQNKKKCWELKDHLIQEKKYMKTDDKIFEDNTRDGFSICKMKIDLVYGLPNHEKKHTMTHFN